MAWSAKTAILTAASVAPGTPVRSTVVILNPGESAQVQIDANFPVGLTDNLSVEVHSTLDDTAERWDDTPVQKPFEIDNGIDPNAATIFVGGMPSVYRFSLFVSVAGSTDTITVDASYRSDGVSL